MDGYNMYEKERIILITISYLEFANGPAYYLNAVTREEDFNI